METKETENRTATSVISNPGPEKACALPGDPSCPTETPGRAKGEAIGGAVGHAVGGAVDVVVGAVAGGIAAGKSGVAATRSTDSAAEHAFWRQEYQKRSYFTQGTPYEQYGPAFQYGWDSHAAHSGKTFNEVEPQLGRDWEIRRGRSQLSWKHAKDAAQDAWLRAAKAEQARSSGSI